MKVLVYLALSSHGYGHAARQSAVVSALHALHPLWRFVVSSKVDPAFLKLVFAGLPVLFRQLRWDVGMVQADALHCDEQATLMALRTLKHHLPEQIDEEARWIRAQGLPVVVLGDIPPAISTLARRIHAPLLWMGNFGWDDIYSPLGRAFQAHCLEAREAYASGDRLLRMPFDLAMDWGVPERSIGLISAQPRPVPLDFQHCLSSLQTRLVFVGFGGLGLSIDPRLFDLWPDHHFLMAPPSDPRHADKLRAITNVTLLPAGVRPVDVMPMCERLLGKPGFSTFSEALSAGLGLHVVEREGFAEARALMQGLRRHGCHRLLSARGFAEGDWQLNQPLIPSREAPLPANGAEAAALEISLLVKRGSA